MANVPIEQPYFGQRLRTIREHMGMTRQELADQSGVTFRTILDIEKGKRRKIQEKTLFQLARGSGCSANELLGLEPIPGIDPAPEPNPTPAVLPKPTAATPFQKTSRKAVVWRWGGAIAGAAVVVAAAVWGVENWPRIPKTNRKTSVGSVLPSSIIQNLTTDVPCAYRAYVEGEEAMNRLDRDAARDAFHRAIACDSSFAMAYAMLTHPYIYPLRDERIRLIEAAKRHAGHCTLHERLMIASLGDIVYGHQEDARRTLERLVAKYPRDAEAHRLLGHLYSNAREYGRSIAAFETAVRINPRDGMSMNRLAYEYATVGDFDHAMDAVNRYIQLAPHEANPYDTRGDILAASGHPKEAMASYREALARDPNFFPSLLSVGSLHIANGEYNEARRILRRVLGVKDVGARRQARIFLSCIALRQGKLAEAVAHFDRAIAADEIEGPPDQAYCSTLALKAMTQAERGNVDEAITELERLHQRFSKSTWYGDYAQVYPMVMARRDPARALALADSLRTELTALVVPQRAVDNKYWQAIGCVRLATGDAQGARTAFARMDPTNPAWDILYPKALADFRSGHVEDAAAGFEAALHRYRSNREPCSVWAVEARYYLGRCYEALDRPGDAEVMYEEFLSIWKDADPVFPEINDARARLTALGHVAATGDRRDTKPGPSDPR